jgi:hypothetical protein
MGLRKGGEIDDKLMCIAGSSVSASSPRETVAIYSRRLSTDFFH